MPYKIIQSIAIDNSIKSNKKRELLIAEIDLIPIEDLLYNCSAATVIKIGRAIGIKEKSKLRIIIALSQLTEREIEIPPISKQFEEQIKKKYKIYNLPLYLRYGGCKSDKIIKLLK